MQTEMISEATRGKIDGILRGELASYLVDGPHGRIEFHIENDSDGDPMIVIDVHYNQRGEPLSGAKLNRLLVRVRDELLQTGDSRFPHIRHRFANGQRFQRV